MGTVQPLQAPIGLGMGYPCLDVGQPCPFDERPPLRTDELAPVVVDDLRLPGVALG